MKTGYYQAKKQNQTISFAPSSSREVSSSVWKVIWKVNVPLKIKHFRWKICQNALQLMKICGRRRFRGPLCEVENETIEHMLLFCEWTRAIWFGLQLHEVLNRARTTSIHEWLGERFKEFEDVQGFEFKEFARISLCCALWSIWKGRNQAVFGYL